MAESNFLKMEKEVIAQAVMKLMSDFDDSFCVAVECLKCEEIEWVTFLLIHPF